MTKTRMCIHIAARSAHTHKKTSCSKQDNLGVPLKIENSSMSCGQAAITISVHVQQSLPKSERIQQRVYDYKYIYISAEVNRTEYK